MLHILYGKDSFSRLEALRALKQRLDTDGMLEANTVTLQARDTTPQEVIAACDTVPFLAACRLVIVEGLFQASPGGRGKRARKTGVADQADAGAWQALADYAGRIPPTTTLVLIDGEVSAANPLLKALAGKGETRHFIPPEWRDAAGWVMARAKKMGLALEPGAAKALADLAGADTWLLAGELEKLACYAAGAPIREADVRELVGAARELMAYDLADAVVEGRGAAATRLFHELVAQGRVIGALLSTIEGRYRRLAIVRDLLDSGAGKAAVERTLGVKPYAAGRLMDQVSRYSAGRLKAAMTRIVQADADIKRGACDEDVSIELMIQDLAGAAASRAA